MYIIAMYKINWTESDVGKSPKFNVSHVLFVLCPTLHLKRAVGLAQMILEEHALRTGPPTVVEVKYSVH